MMEYARNVLKIIYVNKFNLSVSTDNKSCVEIDNSLNCLSYTRLECTQCKQNFILMKDFYEFYFDPNVINYLDHLYFYLTFEQKQKNLMGKSYCQVAEVSNCLEYLNSKECLKCNEGYLLTLVYHIYFASY